MAAPTTLTVGQLDTIYFNQLAQLAAESVGLTREILGNEYGVITALTKGNIFEYPDPQTGQPRQLGALRMTTDQASEFLDHFDILDVQSNTSSGFAGIALRDRTTGQITVAYRSTEPRPASYGGDAEHDIMANGQMRDTGFAMAQTHDANQFLEGVAGTYNNEPGSPPIKLVGFSLSGNIIRTQSETIDDGSPRRQSLGSATAESVVVQTHVQGDAALQDAGAGRVLAGQGAGYFLGDEADLTVVSDGPTPAGDGNQTGRNPLHIAAGDPRFPSFSRPKRIDKSIDDIPMCIFVKHSHGATIPGHPI